MKRQEVEAKVIAMCRHLSSLDEDRVHENNNVGWNGRDSEFGHSLAERNRLSDRQIEAGLKMLRIYKNSQLDPAGFNWEEVSDGWQHVEVSEELPTPSRPMQAKWAGVCAACKRSIDVGMWFYFQGKLKYHSPTCDGMPEPTLESHEPVTSTPPLDDIAAARAVLGTAIIDSPKPTKAALAASWGQETVVLGPSEGRARFMLGPDGPIAESLEGYEVREEQLKLTDAIEAAVSSRTNLVGEAPTGTGKSLSYSVPAIMWAVENDGHVCVSTGDKALQEQIVRKDLPFLQEHMGVPFTHAILKGRQNYVCALNVNELKEGEQEFPSQEASDAFPQFVQFFDQCNEEDRVADIEELAIPSDLRHAVTISSDQCLGKKCPFFDSCHVEKAKGRAFKAHVFVVNHALLMNDLNVRFMTDGYASILPNIDILILDEVHKVQDVATDAFDSEVSVGRWNLIDGGINKLLKGHTEGHDEDAQSAEQIIKLCDAVSEKLRDFMDDLLKRMGKEKTMRLGDEGVKIGDVPDKLLTLGMVLKNKRPWYLNERQRETWDRYRKMVENFMNAINVTCIEGISGYVRYAESEGTRAGGKRVTLHSKPIDVAQPLRDRLWEAPLTRRSRTNTAQDEVLVPPTVICVSATIATNREFSFFRRNVGMDRAAEIITDSPFDYPNISLLYQPQDAESFNPKMSYVPNGMDDTEDSRKYYDTMAQRIEDLILASDGRAFVLTTSFKGMDKLWDRMPMRLRNNYTFMRQGQDGLSRPELVSRFKADGHAVLFGTSSFWEGVDISGEALSLVIIDKMPFPPQDDVIWSARAERIKARGGNDFVELFIPYAIVKIKQGVGRLIRRKDDRGVVALLDGRLVTARYGAQVIRSLPPMKQTKSLEEVQKFYGE